LKPQRPKSATNITIKQNKPIKQKGDFYRAFEDVYRGTREEIKERLRVYLPFALHCQELYDECKILDLGCGRGEWLELMSENGFKAFGVDLDDGMLDACREKALHAEKKDALATLEQMPDESLVIVSGFHIAEHLSFTILQGVVEQSLRVLKPGGLLILETPNPENILVGAMSFYLDPTHLRPLPPQLLSFLPVFYGFERTKILRLQDSPKLRGSEKITILDVLSSPAYHSGYPVLKDVF
jgi:SAM-dependent methyltransferase